MQDKPVYIEPSDYIPEDLRRKYKLGEYADIYQDQKEHPEHSVKERLNNNTDPA